MDDSTGMSIGEVARRAGVRPSAIRFYESVGVLPQPERAAGQRRYDPSILTWLRLVASASEAGFTMAEIRKLMSGFDPRTPPALRWRTLALGKLAEVDALVDRAERMRAMLQNALACECVRLEDCGRLLGSSQDRAARGRRR